MHTLIPPAVLPRHTLRTGFIQPSWLKAKDVRRNFALRLKAEGQCRASSGRISQAVLAELLWQA